MSKKKYDSVEVESIEDDEEMPIKKSRTRRPKVDVLLESIKKVGRLLVIVAAETDNTDNAENLLLLAKDARLLRTKIEELF